ncbi:single-stranded DNA-binding protein [Demequina sp. NBRC 110057]|uniref:single-stranded DNA-binding protein n=1 Tax=Demequina sp. NBRC 110057 TaxID=1570346 RepID=UPI000A05DE95|nr:single-stranded DNA-binding protein [Demequina sp. NBRC 110057]
MSDLDVTVTGWVATKPVVRELADNKSMCAFRMAHSSRYRDAAGEWKDGATEWISVRMFRTGAQRVGQSIHVGEPVIVSGRLKTNTWIDKDNAERHELQIDARAVGHDLVWGTASFVRHVEAKASDADEDAGEDAGAPREEPAGIPDSFEQRDDETPDGVEEDDAARVAV